MKWFAYFASLAAGLFPVPAAQLGPGALDPDFLPNGALETSYILLALQPENRSLVFTNEWPPLQPDRYLAYLVRLKPDGQVDGTLHAAVQYHFGWNWAIKAAAVQPDGKILIAGAFFEVNGVAMPGVARFNADGTLDPSFKPGNASPEYPGITAMALQSDGRIYLGGSFGGQSPMLRLAPDGALDSHFIARLGPAGIPSWQTRVTKILISPDGGILVAFGDLRRILPDGSLDPAFVSHPTLSISDVDLQADGRIIAGVQEYHGGSQRLLVRYLPDGALDPAFTPVTVYNTDRGDAVSTVKVDANDRILVGGPFSKLFGYARSGVARLLKDGGIDASFEPGTVIYPNFAPKFLLQSDGKVLLDASTTHLDGTSRLYSLARLLAGEKAHAAPVWLTTPENLTVEAGYNALFTSEASGFPLTYQWFKEGKQLPGATNSWLYLESLTPEGAGYYSVEVGNDLGRIASPPAQVTVVPPPTPANLVVNPGFEHSSLGYYFEPRQTYWPNFDTPGWAPKNYPGGARYSPGSYPVMYIPPISLPIQFGDTQYPVRGTNFAGIYSGAYDNYSQFCTCALVGTLEPTTKPGQPYQVNAWLRRTTTQTLPEEKVAVLLEDAQGHSLAVGTASVRDTQAWTLFSATAIVSREYNHIVLRGQNDPDARSINGLVWLDQISVFPLTQRPLVLASIPDLKTMPGDSFLWTNRVTGVDVFDSALSYRLDPGAPEGMMIDPETGILAWNVLPSQALSSWNVTVKVQVTANPDLAATVGFKVETGEAVVLKLDSVAVASGAEARIPIQLTPYLKPQNRLSQIAFTVVSKPGNLTPWAIETVSSQVESAQIVPAGDGRFTVTLTAAPGQGLAPAETLAILSATTGSHSAVVPLAVADGEALTADNAKLPLLPPRLAHVFIVGRETFLWADTEGGQSRVLRVLGPPGTRVAVGSATSLRTPVLWQPFKEVTLSGLMETINDIPVEPSAIFFQILR